MESAKCSVLGPFGNQRAPHAGSSSERPVGVSFIEISRSRFITDLRKSFFNVISHEVVRVIECGHQNRLQVWVPVVTQGRGCVDP